MKRLTEPSTWAGFAAIFQVMKAFVPVQYHPLVDIATTAAGSLAAAMPEVKAQ